MAKEEGKKDEGKKVAPAVVELSKHGGGFMAVELIPEASVGPLQKRQRLTCQGTCVVATLGCTPKDLPAEQVPCRTTWYLAPQRKSSYPGTGILDVKDKTLKVALDVASHKLGRLLESGAPLAVSVTPDVPHAIPASLELKGETLPKLAATLSWEGVTSLLSEVKKLQEVRIGDAVKVSLERSSFACWLGYPCWSCHVRLWIGYIDNTGKEAYAFLSFGTHATQATWYVGVDRGALLPIAPKDGKLTFRLQLQVSADGESWESLTAGSSDLVLPAAVLTRFSTVAGNDGYHASGAFTGMTTQRTPPLWLEPWELAAPKGGSGIIHPVGKRVRLPKLNSDGTFDVRLKPDHSMSGSPFAILRAGDATPLPMFPKGLRVGELRLFGDEDFSVNDPRGVCSTPIDKNTKATREPVIGAASWSIEGGNFVLTCDVLGSQQQYWSKTKPTFILKTHPDRPSIAKVDAKYVRAQTGEAGRLVALVPFQKLGNIAGHPALTARLDPGAAPPLTEPQKASSTSGIVGPFSTRITVGPVSYKDGDESLYFECPVTFFPKDQGFTLDVTFIVNTAGGPKTEDFKIQWKDSRPNQPKDGKLMFRCHDKDRRKRLVELIKGDKENVDVRVGRPKGQEKLYDNDGLIVREWKGRPGSK